MRDLIERIESMMDEGITDAQRKNIPKSGFLYPGRRGWPVKSKKRAMIAIKYIKTRFRTPSDPSEYADLVKRAKKVIGQIHKNDPEVMDALKGI